MEHLQEETEVYVSYGETFTINMPRIAENPYGVKTLKRYVLSTWWPRVVEMFYPDGITFEEKLEEVFLLDEFKTLWSETAVGIIMDIMEETFEIDMNEVRGALMQILGELLKKLL
jgi:hypothetical protein